VRTSYPIQNVQVEEEVRISQQEHELKSLRYILSMLYFPHRFRD